MALNPGENAAQACKQISSQAQNITAAANGGAKLINSILGPFSPKNYVSDNDTASQLRNVLGMDLSSNDISTINNSCKNISTGIQSNKLQTDQCPYCRECKTGNCCPISNVRQSNVASSNQTCIAKALIDVLRQKHNTVEASAAAKAVQDATGLLASNTSSTDQCNYVNTDMSSEAYLEQINKCSNTSSIDQSNNIGACDAVFNVLQENSLANFQKCLANSTTELKEEIKSNVAAKTESYVEQHATGLDLGSCSISVIVIVIICIVCVLVCIGLSYGTYKASTAMLPTTP